MITEDNKCHQYKEYCVFKKGNKGQVIKIVSTQQVIEMDAKMEKP